MVKDEVVCTVNNDNELGKGTQRLWIIQFYVFKNKGCAVVKAENSKKAELLLKAEGSYNGQPNSYEITRIEEILPSPNNMVLAEQILMTNNL